MKENLPPRMYAEQVLGKAATSEQLDELFALHAAAHPVVTHDVVTEIQIRGEWWHNLKRTTVEIYGLNPAAAQYPVVTVAKGVAILSPNDQWNKRRGVEVAFGRALRALREQVEGPKRRKPPRAAELSTGRMLELLANYVKDAESGIVGLAYKAGRGWMVSAEFGEETPGSEMVGGAAYGSGEHLREALLPAVRDCGLVVREEDVDAGTS